MEISTKGIYEIGMDGKSIILTYSTEKECYEALRKIREKGEKFIQETFPNGIFNK